MTENPSSKCENIHDAVCAAVRVVIIENLICAGSV